MREVEHHQNTGDRRLHRIRLHEGGADFTVVRADILRQDVEAAVNDGMKAQASIDYRQLFVCEVVDKNLEDEYMEDVNECTEKCHTQENHDEFAWDGVNSGKLDPTWVREARRVAMGVLSEKCKFTRRYQSKGARTRQGRCRSSSGGLTQTSETKRTPTSAVGSSQRSSRGTSSRAKKGKVRNILANDVARVLQRAQHVVSVCEAL